MEIMIDIEFAWVIGLFIISKCVFYGFVFTKILKMYKEKKGVKKEKFDKLCEDCEYEYLRKKKDVAK